MSAPVDVRAAIRHAVSALHGAADDGADTRRYADALHKAGVAVDELIAERDARERWIEHLAAFIGPGAMPGLRKSFDEGHAPGGAALARVGGGA